VKYSQAEDLANVLSAVRVRSIASIVSVCLFVCLKNHSSKFHQYFWFCGPESKTTHMFRPVRMVVAPGAKSAISDYILLFILCAWYNLPQLDFYPIYFFGIQGTCIKEAT